MRNKIPPCDICGQEYNKELCDIANKFFSDDDPCFCNQIKMVKKLKQKIESLKEEISNLNCLLNDGGESDWDQEGMYYDAYLGTFNGNNIGGIPDKKYSKWLAKRYGFEIDKDGDII